MHYEILSGQTKKGNKKAGDGNRTHVSSLEGWCSTIELHPHVVGVTGFEPATSWSQTRRSSQAEPHPEGFVCVLSVTQELVYSKGQNMSTTFFKFFIFIFFRPSVPCCTGGRRSVWSGFGGLFQQLPDLLRGEPLTAVTELTGQLDAVGVLRQLRKLLAAQTHQCRGHPLPAAIAAVRNFVNSF